MRLSLSVVFILSFGALDLGCSHLATSSDQSGWHEITYPKGSGCEDETGRLPATTIYGDFDGDGKQDRASLIQKNPKKESLMVWLASKKEPIELDAVDSPGYMTLSLAKTGDVIQSACKRGYRDLCNEHEPKEIKLSTDAIWYVHCESAASIFYWNMKASRFDRLWYSD